ncbi:MmcQ/YjbR family DNA-binding protein [Pseudoruegeria sp. HB172150]|uniref:MmcQ/YjbR family DNA-binding protein n=1 Tax=Pseudoruegeria sp. HB172150 TaxID=2721164 RepID=UPI001554C1E1|nr:MmcQ/YjbR family DNA-binding protein [Pseudoruegeria sp. HB172150]
MTREEIAAYCEAQQGVTRDQSFGKGIDCWRVGPSVFAMMAEGADRLSVKSGAEDAAQSLSASARAATLPHGNWATLDLSTGEEELKSRILESYQMALESLNPSERAALP